MKTPLALIEVEVYNELSDSDKMMLTEDCIRYIAEAVDRDDREIPLDAKIQSNIVPFLTDAVRDLRR